MPPFASCSRATGPGAAPGTASLLLAAAIVGILYWLDAHPIPTIYDSAGLVDVLFVPLVLTLAMGVGTLPALLSIRPMVYLGHISFSLYMVHELVHTTWNWMVMQFGLRLGSDLAGKATLVGLLAVALAGAVRAVPRRRGAGPPMDARHDETAPRLARGPRSTASCNRSTGRKTSGASGFGPCRMSSRVVDVRSGQMSPRLVR